MFLRRSGIALAACLALVATGCSNDKGDAQPRVSEPAGVASSQLPTPSDTETPADGATPSQPTSGEGSPSVPETTETPSASIDVGASAQSSEQAPSALTTPSVAAPTVALKQASAAKLPSTLDGLQGNVSSTDEKTSIGQYTGTTEDEMLVATLTIGQERAAALGQVTKPVTQGHTTCGTLASTGLVGCYLWLDGGNVQLYGTNHTTADQLRKHAESLYEKLA